jgi:hypothetical protein
MLRKIFFSYGNYIYLSSEVQENYGNMKFAALLFICFAEKERSPGS